MKVSFAVSVQYHACLAFRLSGRRPGLGRRHDDVCRAPAPDRAAPRSSTWPIPSNPRLLARIDMPDGWHSHKVRVCGDIMIVNHEKFGKAGRGEFGGGIAIYDVVAAERAEADHQMADRRRRRAPLRFRRPLRVYLAHGRGLHRQYHDDPRPRGSREADGGRALVDSRASGRRAARPIRGRTGCRRAATIRCVSATGSMSATGITASSSSTSPTCRSRSRSPTSIPARRSRIRRTPACAFRKSCSGRDIMIVADEDVAKLLAVARRPSRGSTTSPTSAAGADRDLSGARPRYRRSAAAGDDRLPSAVGALSRHRHSVRLVRAGPAASSTSPIRSRRTRSAIFCRSPPTAWSGCLRTT